MKLPHNSSRADITGVWPSCDLPFNPRSNLCRNVFSLMPFKHIELLGSDTEARVNVATYRNGETQHTKPRWEQGLLVRFNSIDYAQKVHRNNRKLVEAVTPGYKRFKGYVLDPENYVVDVEGIIHPSQEGWMALDRASLQETTGWDQPLATVADLKYLIGKIPREEAEQQRTKYSNFGHFVVNGQWMI